MEWRIAVGRSRVAGAERKVCRVGLVANSLLGGVRHEAPHGTGRADFSHPAQDNLLTLRRVSHGREFC